MPDHGAQFEVVYAPAFAGGNLEGEGRWFYTEQGFIWTNDAGNVNLLDFDNIDAVQKFNEAKNTAQSQGLSAQEFFERAAETQYDEVGEEVVSGNLEDLADEWAVGMEAPGSDQGVVEDSEYGITIDDDGNLLELVRIASDGVFVRDNNTWVAYDPDEAEEDDTVYGREWYDVNDQAIDLYDTSSAADMLSKDDFIPFILS